LANTSLPSRDIKLTCPASPWKQKFENLPVFVGFVGKLSVSEPTGSPAEILRRASSRHIRGPSKAILKDQYKSPNELILRKTHIPAMIVILTNSDKRKALPGLSGDFSLSGKRVEGETAEVEEDVRLESFPVSVAA
jgi:hypothetical protein